MKRNNFTSRLAAITLAAACTMTPVFPVMTADSGTADNPYFRDVAESSWYYSPVQWAAKNKIAYGKSADGFMPDDTCTRAEIVSFLYRAAGSPTVEKSNKFTDVAADAWYADAVSWAVAKNVTAGTTADTFTPDRECTRAEIVSFLYRAAGSPKADKTSRFTDVAADAWYADAVNWAAEQGIAAGMTETTFEPNATATRAQAVSFIYRAQKFLTAKSDDPSKKDDQKNNNQGKTDSGNNSKDDNSKGHSSDVTPVTPVVRTSTVKEDQTKLIDLGYAQFVAVSYDKGYNLDNTKVEVDGTDVTEAMTPVSDDKTIAKWEITSLNPASVKVTSRSDASKSETVKLSDNKNPVKPVVKKDTSADYFLAYGAVPVWDYYLTNYDEEGNPRVHAARTTFSKSGKDVKVNEHPYYSPAAEMKDGRAEVQIMFNYNTDKEKAWFDKIDEKGALELVSNDQYRNVLNNHLTYTIEKNVEHGSGHVGILKIKTPQDNFRNNGRYLVRVRSTGSPAVLAGIHVVDAKAPVMKLSENRAIRSGQNVHFNIDGLVYGIKEPVEKAVLEKPDGTKENLKFIDDYYLFGDLFVLYNDPKRSDNTGVNHIDQNGTYKITVSCEGYKDVSKSFKVTDGKPVVKKAMAARPAAARVDAVSMATSTGGGYSSGGASGGAMMTANIVFNADLLNNAEIFDELGLKNEAAEGIVDRYETEVTDMIAAYDLGDKFYDYNDYFNAVNDAELNNKKYLSFADYKHDGKGKTVNGVSTAKEVLEDNLLGDIQDEGSFARKDAPKFADTDISVNEGEDAVFNGDKEYLSKVTMISNHENMYGYTNSLTENDYKVDPKSGKITIKAKALKLGENHFSVKADGYKTVKLTVNCKKVNEDITLEVKTEKPEQGRDVLVKLNGSKGDFAKYITSVQLTDPNGESINVHREGAGGDDDYYKFNKSGTELTLSGGLFDMGGRYKLTLKANYYDEPLEASFDLAETQITEGTKAVPEVISSERNGNTVDVNMQSSDTKNQKALAEWYKAVSKVKVGDRTYTESFSGNYSYSEIIDSAYGYMKGIKLTSDGFNEDADTTVVISAEGYKNLTFTVQKDGSLKPAEKKEMNIIPSADRDAGQLVLSLKSYDSEYAEWLKSVTGVRVGDRELKKDKNTWYAGSYELDDTWINGENSLALPDKALADGANNVVVSADGYKDVAWKITKESDGHGNITYTVEKGTAEQTGKDETPGVKPTEEKEMTYIPSVDSNYYWINFSTPYPYNESFKAWLPKIQNVKVDGTELGEAESAYNIGPENKYFKGEANLYLGTSTLKASSNEEKTFKVEIEAEGYKTVNWEVTVNNHDNRIDYTIKLTEGGSAAEQTGEDAPKAKSVHLAPAGLDNAYYYIDFGQYNDAAREYLTKSITSVTIGGVTYEKTDGYISSAAGNKFNFGNGNNGYDNWLQFTAGGGINENGDTTVVIKADGYKDLTVTFDKDLNIVE